MLRIDRPFKLIFQKIIYLKTITESCLETQNCSTPLVTKNKKYSLISKTDGSVIRIQIVYITFLISQMKCNWREFNKGLPQFASDSVTSSRRAIARSLTSASDLSSLERYSHLKSRIYLYLIFSQNTYKIKCNLYYRNCFLLIISFFFVNNTKLI